MLSAQHAFSANFNITPYGTLPTRVIKGQSVSANYTVSNLTNSARNGYFITGLPATVTQNSTSPNCSSPINLEAQASCNLQLNITGAVSSNFAICKGNSCTTANTPLSVTETPIPPPNPRFAYVTSNANPVVQVCSINPNSGLNPGALTSCVSAITGSTSGTPPTGNVQGITFNTAGTVAYLTSFSPSPTNSAFQCSINQTDGTFTTCSQVGIVSPSNPSVYYAYYGFPAVNSDSSYAFFAGFYAPNVFTCPISNGVLSGNCFNTGVTNTFYTSVEISLNPANSALYIGNGFADGSVAVCTGSGGTYNVCQNITGDAGSVTFAGPSGVFFDSTNTHLYVSDYLGGVVYYCTASQQNATQFTSCLAATTVIPSPWTTKVNAARTFAYVVQYTSNVYVCAVNAIDGSLSSCSHPTSFSSPVDVALLY